MNAPRHLTPAEASAGHNRPAVLTPDMLARDFAYLDTALAEIEKQYNDVPPVCEDNEDLEIMRSAVKRFQGGWKRFEAVRVEAKGPYLDAERITDSHFNTRKSKLEAWQADVEGRAHRFLKKKEAAEKARREQEARQAADAARAAAERQRQAEEKSRQAERQRLAYEHTSQRINVEDHQRQENARLEETRLRQEAEQAQAAALKAQQAVEAKPADMARTRTGTGVSTLQQIWCFEVTDAHAIDLSDPVLRSFIPWPVVEKAIARYVDLHKDTRPLAGVRIYTDTKPMMT